MKKWLIVMGVSVVILGLLGWWIWGRRAGVSPLGIKKELGERVYEKYDFDSLKASYKVSKVSKVYKVEMLGNIPEVESRRKDLGLKSVGFKTQKFRFLSEGKWITGMVNMPLTPMSNKLPAIIMIRGYTDAEGYYSGSGTWRVADELARVGYVTVSLDFLGFAGSEAESTDILEARFVKVVNVLDLIESVKKLGIVDPNKIGIWAHSNGGQIALSVLEVSGANYPTVLWAPMTKPFPQSVLETITDDEGGRYVKQKVDEFLSRYDPRRFAMENYYGWVKAPVLIQQGTADEWCKVEWQEKVIEGINMSGGEAALVVYQGDDHSLSRNWEEAVEKDKEWYKMLR
ncbi:MAG: prolyl oligopeptidase family serine peptidase [Candidatus Shapirobacteria bacterium]